MLAGMALGRAIIEKLHSLADSHIALRTAFDHDPSLSSDVSQFRNPIRGVA